MRSFVSVYVDMAAGAAEVREAVARLPVPKDVVRVEVDDGLMSDTFGCRIAVDLTGSFDERLQGPTIARHYADALAAQIGVPAYAFYDLVRSEYPAS
ncbi:MULTISPECIES: hypothetical protein [unclassified Mycobacterium]|jgi:hypothetical protein|uniref:hypothetical protein n=1 Tax=unclassified Mycobacterium TaxID=2642494 RepID=UPI0029C7194A|nr:MULTISPECIES: hypothetical protein [unclassified Mycobacterium]